MLDCMFALSRVYICVLFCTVVRAFLGSFCAVFIAQYFRVYLPASIVGFRSEQF